MSYSNEEIRKWHMWDHFCTVEQAMMGMEKGKECNWCGITEEKALELGNNNELLLDETNEEGTLLTEKLKGLPHDDGNS